MALGSKLWPLSLESRSRASLRRCMYCCRMLEGRKASSVMLLAELAADGPCCGSKEYLSLSRISTETLSSESALPEKDGLGIFASLQSLESENSG